MSEQLGFDRIVYFGDSLTDSDEFFSASSAVAVFGLPPLAAGYAGRFSNGAVYAGLAPDLLGVEGGDALNYAVGGAQALTDRTIEDLLAGSGLIRPDATAEDLAYRVDYKGQVARFLGDPASDGDLSGTAVSIFVGVNDYNDFAPTSAQTAGQEAVAYGAQIATTALADTLPLIEAGVGTVILHTIPLVSVFPSTNGATPEEEALFGAVDAGYNGALRAGAEQLEALGVDVIVVDFAAIFAEVDADPETYGFRLFEEQVLVGPNGAGGINPAVIGVPLDQIGFFDEVHPTAAFHGVIAAFQAESLTSHVEIGDETNDHIRGTRGDDLALASGGDDYVNLRNGDDVGLGGLGRDILIGGRGEDLLSGGAGRDKLFGGSGDDVIADGSGNDYANGGRGDDVFIDGAGSDFHIGGGGDDLFIFTEASLFGAEEEGRDVVFGGRGHDTLVLRVEDEDADLGIFQFGSFTRIDALGVTALGVESVIVVGGTDLSDEEFYNAGLAQADLWNFV